MISFDTTNVPIAAARSSVQPVNADHEAAQRMRPVPPASTPIFNTLASTGAAGMIFLRRDAERGWFARFFGVKGVGGQNEMPLPAPTSATVAQIIERMQGKFPGTWLLIAP